MSKVEKGQTVKVHYIGTFDDGVEFDSSHSRNQPLTFEVGSDQMIPGFDAALPGMEVGEKKNIHLEPDIAYGPTNPAAVQVVPKNVFPPDFKAIVGATVAGQNQEGKQLMAKILAFDMHTITLDMNHPLAGKSLNFEIELLEVHQAS
jgi:FKBP-type peptidyl-prolyl cis-trans isomerase 2